jgi:tetratricopeptide (TPR) repeat protein
MAAMRFLPFGFLLPMILMVGTGCSAPADPAPAAGPTPEATSLLGQPLFPAPIAEDSRNRMEAELAEARAAWEDNPDDSDAIIWLGRRTAYLGRYREAIEIYTNGISRHPRDARLYRHRGHRYISVREFDKAISDLEQAAAFIADRPDEIEPDGQPNARGVPTSTLHSNIYYHLALAHYLSGNYARAAEMWTRARDAVDNPDNLVAASHWLYLAMRRAGRDDAGSVLDRISADLDVIENTSYHSLLLMYKGERDPQVLLDSAAASASGSAVSYGVSAWLLLEGREGEAVAIWKKLVAQPDWASFGHIAAEADLARHLKRSG